MSPTRYRTPPPRIGCARVPDARHGPGRCPAYHGGMPSVPITVRVSEDEATAIDAARGGQSRASWVAVAITAALAVHAGDSPGRKRAVQESGVCPPHPKGRVIKGFCYRCGHLVALVSASWNRLPNLAGTASWRRSRSARIRPGLRLTRAGVRI